MSEDSTAEGEGQDEMWWTSWNENEKEEKPIGDLHEAFTEISGEEWEVNLQQQEKDESVCVFVSHTGQDDSKEQIARPTRWFLETVVGVRAIIDDGDLDAGREKVNELLTKIYKSSHILIILSPKFRQREFCVREINTAMKLINSKMAFTSCPFCGTSKTQKAIIPN